MKGTQSGDEAQSLSTCRHAQPPVCLRDLDRVQVTCTETEALSSVVSKIIKIRCLDMISKHRGALQRDMTPVDTMLMKHKSDEQATLHAQMPDNRSPSNCFYRELSTGKRSHGGHAAKALQGHSRELLESV